MNQSNNQDSSGGVDFSALILGFSSAALHYLGEVSVKDDQATKNTELARQNIDIIEMLKVKTKGNLSADEADLMDQVLADLKVKFVDATK